MADRKLDASDFAFMPLCSVKILARTFGITPEAVLARFKKGSLPREALLRAGNRSLVVDLMTLLPALHAQRGATVDRAVAP